MAQQTQVARVAERWRPFLERFPTPAALRGGAGRRGAAAGGRASGTTAAPCTCTGARTAVVERHGGRLPADLDALLALPGIGPYTARAVLAFAFERDHGVVDTNTARGAGPLGRASGSAPQEVQAAADAAVPAGRGWAWNQAMLDLGATVCTERAPRCEACPVTATLRLARGRLRRARSGRRLRRRVRAARRASRAATARAAAGWWRRCAAAPVPPADARRGDGLARRPGPRRSAWPPPSWPTASPSATDGRPLPAGLAPLTKSRTSRLTTSGCSTGGSGRRRRRPPCASPPT